MIMRPASAKQIEAGLAELRVVTGIVFVMTLGTAALAGPGSPSLDRMLSGRRSGPRR